ncbi:MAG: LysM peptidoglycan-binding domain-containing protein [Actinomycetota bacterium]
MRRIFVPAALALGIMLGTAANVTARQAHKSPFRGTVHVVSPGENLWGIVREAYPGKDPREQIVLVRRANRLRSATITPGQRLRLPAP